LFLLAQAQATELEGAPRILDARFSLASRVLEIRVPGALARAGVSYCSQALVSQVPQGLRPVQDHACEALVALKELECAARLELAQICLQV
jgi:hypothetical protein